MKKIIFGILAIFSVSAWGVCVNTIAQTTAVLSGVTTTGISATCYKWAPGTSNRFVEVVLSGSGAVSGVAALEGSGDCVNFHTLDTFTEAGTTLVSEAVQNNNSAMCMRGNVTAISGVGASFTLNVSTGN